jgi:hypothetical protein
MDLQVHGLSEKHGHYLEVRFLGKHAAIFIDFG